MEVTQATSLLKHGFSLIPVHSMKDGKCSCGNKSCSSPAKHPYPAKWQEVCSSQELAIKTWWKAFKNPNAGIVTGKKSGIVVLDIDPRHNGFDTLDNLQVKYGKIPSTATVETGSKGLHFYFKAPEGDLKNSVNVGGQGVDFRGSNGFVVAPGSIHASGETYDWYDEQTPDSAGFAPLPKWLGELVYKPPVSVNIKNDMVGVSEGGRNVWLAGLAGAIRNKGCGYKTILAALVEANLECCNPPLEPEEVQLIAKSISRYAISGRGVM